MSEIRKDPCSATWVIVSTERGKRPCDFIEKDESKEEKTGGKSKTCPFCRGEEIEAPIKAFSIWPGEIDKETMDWRTRVLPNKFPALSPGIELAQGEVDDFYHFLGGAGGHEVIVDSRRHKDTLSSMEKNQLQAVIKTYCQRYNYWRNDPRVAYVLIFRNYGLEAGASLAHPHSQLVAMPLIPTRISQELEEAKGFYEQEQKCVYCEIIKTEGKNKKSRIIWENETMFALCPFASRFPCEVLMLPRVHAAAFDDLSDAEIKDLARMLSHVFKRIETVLGDPPYNLMIHTAPLRTPGLLYYHWHIEIIPRLTMPAGFEWGTGIYINVVSPEDAANDLRKAKC